MNISLTKVNDQGRQWLLFSEVVFDEATGIATSQKTGFKEIDPDRSDIALASAKSMSWELTDYNPSSGLYEVETTGTLITA